MPQQRIRSIRFDDDTWALIQREARELGVSQSQFVREAALFRAAYRAGLRGATLRDLVGDEAADNIARMMEEGMRPLEEDETFTRRGSGKTPPVKSDDR